MKNVYFVQPSGMLDTSVYLPYSVGCIAAYSFQYQEIKENYKLGDFVFMKSPIDKILPKFENPFIVGFSCYMWNIDYNLALAEEIKKKSPDTIIIFGGPQIPDSTDYLERYSFIDILIHCEGEIPFHSILKQCLNESDFSCIPGISFRTGESIKKNRSAEPPCLDSMPSPYTTGIFDSILNSSEYSNIGFDAILETNRGCPYKCMFCNYSKGNKNLRKFPIERVKQDIDWFGEHQIDFCLCADSNFGVFERDEEIAEYVIETKRKYGFPRKFETASAKNKDELTFRINQKLEDEGLNRGVSVAIQSTSPETLEIIGRKNMPFESFAQQLRNYRENGIGTYTDLILGLPGETLDSFCKGIFKVIEAGQHNSISVHRCEVFPNTELYSEEVKKKYKIKTILSQLCQNHSRVSTDHTFASRSEVIVETSTMSTDEWKTAQEVAMCTQAFHSLGLLRFFGVYLRKAKNIPYYDFYMSLYNWIKADSMIIKSKLERACETIEPFLRGESNIYFADERFGDTYWTFDEGLFLCCAEEIDKFYDEVRLFLNGYFDDEFLFNDLFKYQKEIIALPGKDAKEFTTEYDWADYFDHIFDKSFTQPLRQKTLLKIEASATDNWPDFGREILWYGRRSGKSINKVKKVM